MNDNSGYLLGYDEYENFEIGDDDESERAGGKKKIKIYHEDIDQSLAYNNLDNSQHQYEETVPLFEPDRDSNTTSTSRRILHSNFLNREDDIDILQIPSLLESALNSYNSIELTNVLETYFKVDCVILSKSTEKLCGSNIIFQHYCSIMNKISNCSFKYNIKLKHHRLIVMSETCLGVIFPILFQREE